MNRTERPTPNARRPRREAARDRALALLLDGRSVPAVAAALECSRTTVWAWTREPDFAAELATRRERARDIAEWRLAEAAVTAVETLTEIMGQTYAGPGGRWRIAAAEAVLRIVYPPRPSSPVAVAVADAGAAAVANPDRERIVAELVAEKIARRERMTLEATCTSST